MIFRAAASFAVLAVVTGNRTATWLDKRAALIGHVFGNGSGEEDGDDEEDNMDDDAAADEANDGGNVTTVVVIMSW